MNKWSYTKMRLSIKESNQLKENASYKKVGEAIFINQRCDKHIRNLSAP